MTLNNWITQWLESYKPTVRPSTYQASGYILKNHIIPRLGDYELAALTEEVIGAFLNTVQQEGNHRRDEPMSQQAMRHILALLKQILDAAVTANPIPENHAKQFNYKGKNRVDIEPLDDWEIEEYLSAAEELGYLPMFLLALEYGLRQRELIALRCSDLDSQTRILTIHENRVVEHRALVTYGDETRTIKLSKYAVQQLEQEHLKHPSSDIMFIHPGTLKPYSPAMVRRLHQKVLERAQLPDIHFRDLRHTCAIRNLEAGRSLEDVSSELGRNPDFVTKHRYKNYLPHDVVTEAKIQQAASAQEQQLVADTFQNLLML